MITSEKSQDTQDVFLKYIQKNKLPIIIFLVGGVKLQGILTWFDDFSLLLIRDEHSQLIYKHAIASVMPVASVPFFEHILVDAVKNEKNDK